MTRESILINQESHGETAIADIEICKAVAAVLMRHYEGHVWHVGCDSSATVRMIDIKLNYPDKLGCLPKYGYKMKIDGCTDAKIMRAGGELLERYRLARSRATQYSMANAIENGVDKSGMVK